MSSIQRFSDCSRAHNCVTESFPQARQRLLQTGGSEDAVGRGKEAVPSRRRRTGQHPEPHQPRLRQLADLQAQPARVDRPQQQRGKAFSPCNNLDSARRFLLCVCRSWLVISFSQTGGRFKWVDNWLLSYTKWGADEPKSNQGCVYMDVDGKWKTAPCTNNYFSLCKRSPGQTIPPFPLSERRLLG